MALLVTSNLALFLGLHFSTLIGADVQFYTRCSTEIIYSMENNCPFTCYARKMYSSLMCERDGATAVPCDPFNKTQMCLALPCRGNRTACPQGTSQHRTEKFFRLLDESEPGYAQNRNHLNKHRRSEDYSGNFSSTYTYTYTIFFVLLILVLVCLTANRCFKYYSKILKNRPNSHGKPQVPTISLGVQLDMDPLSRNYSRSAANLALITRQEVTGPMTRAVSAPPASTVTIQVRPAHERSTVHLCKDLPPPYSVATQLAIPPPAYEDISSGSMCHSYRLL